MNFGPEILLIVSVGVVGVLHTIVPDHWVPIALLARQRGWSKAETARAALQAGVGHVVSTLIIAAVIWIAGVAIAARFAHLVDSAASIALIAFGGWIAIAAWRDLHRAAGHGAGHDHGRGHGHSHSHSHRLSFPGEHDHHDHDPARSGDHDDDDPHGPSVRDDPLYAPMRSGVATLVRHRHAHRHGARGAVHVHWHDHDAATAHPAPSDLNASPPLHAHMHKTTGRTALLLVLGSSPMVEGIPAFFAAAKFGLGVVVAMALVFAASTIATYILFSVYSSAGLERLHFGAFERYGEVSSGAFIALVGVAFWLWPVL